MPGQYRYSIDRISEELDQVCLAGVKSILLFGIPSTKMPAEVVHGRKMALCRRRSCLSRNSIPLCIVLRMFVCANTRPMGIVEFWTGEL